MTIQLDGIKGSIRHLIANSSVSIREIEKRLFKKDKGFKKAGIEKSAGGYFSENAFTLWFESTKDRVCEIHVTREIIPLSQQEIKLLGRAPDAISGLMILPARPNLVLSQNISSYLSFEHLLISKYLRGGHASTYWVPAFIIILLQRLTFERYEGSRCTSGFIFTSQPALYIEELRAATGYEFIAFDEFVSLNETFFSKPASFRYVDGKNSFYLIDNLRHVHGIIRNTTPTKYSIIDRCSNRHISALVDKMPGRVWLANAGDNDEVNIYRSGNLHLRWAKNHWRLRDGSLLALLLTEHNCKEIFIHDLCSVVITLSELRMGSVILIPDHDGSLPEVIGRIDNSLLGNSLRKSVLNCSLSDLIHSNSVLGVLSSDGLTSISKSGKVISCGDIINLTCSSAVDSEVSSEAGNANLLSKRLSRLKKRPYIPENYSGGGRSQAALIASHFGLAIKISEDGPISVFYHGVELIKL